MCGYGDEVRKNGKEEGYLIGVTRGRHMFTMRHSLGPGLWAHVCHVVDDGGKVYASGE